MLQYPGDNGNYWSVKSWWVTLDMGAAASDEVQLKAGDVIFGNMTQTGKSAWFIDSVSTNTGKHTSLTAKGLGARLDAQPWAYVTMECYGCTGCDTLPPGNGTFAFTGLQLTQEDGSPVTTIPWAANPKPAKDRTCAESIAIFNSTNVNIYSGAP